MEQFKSAGLICVQSHSPLSMTWSVAPLLLLLIGCMTILGMTFNVEPLP